jgi:hypothetical protein
MIQLLGAQAPIALATTAPAPTTLFLMAPVAQAPTVMVPVAPAPAVLAGSDSSLSDGSGGSDSNCSGSNIIRPRRDASS